MYTHHKPYEEGVENFLAVATQVELLLTVFFALLGMLRGVEMERGADAHMIGAILSVGVVVITVLGLIIIVVAICKASPHEPWVRWIVHSFIANVGINNGTNVGNERVPTLV